MDEWTDLLGRRHGVSMMWCWCRLASGCSEASV